MSHDTVAHAAHGAPGDLLDLSRWKLTLPIAEPNGDPHKPWEVDRPQLRTFSGNRDEYNHYFSVRDGALTYVAPVKGVTTSGSDATRCELRELDAHGKNAAWTLGSGIHTLTCTLSCDASGASPHEKCIVGQIHDKQGTPPIYLAVGTDGGSATLNAYVRGTSPHRNKVLDGLEPDTVFSYRIRIEDRECRLWVAHGDTLPSDPTTTFDKSDLGDPGRCFLKAGAYNKSEVEHGSGEVVVRHMRLEPE